MEPCDVCRCEECECATNPYFGGEDESEDRWTEQDMINDERHQARIPEMERPNGLEFPDEPDTFEVTIWWYFECHGAAVWGQHTDWHTREEIARLFMDRHLVAIKVGGQVFDHMCEIWCMLSADFDGFDFTSSTNTECQTCLRLGEKDTSSEEDLEEGYVDSEGYLNFNIEEGVE